MLFPFQICILPHVLRRVQPRIVNSLQHDTLVQIYELPQGPNLSPAHTDSGLSFGIIIFIWLNATSLSQVPSSPVPTLLS